MNDRASYHAGKNAHANIVRIRSDDCLSAEGQFSSRSTVFSAKRHSGVARSPLSLLDSCRHSLANVSCIAHLPDSLA